MTPLETLSKLLEALGRMTSSVTLVEKSKDKTERCCKDEYKPKLTPWYRCIIAFQGPALFTYM